MYNREDLERAAEKGMDYFSMPRYVQGRNRKTHERPFNIKYDGAVYKNMTQMARVLNCPLWVVREYAWGRIDQAEFERLWDDHSLRKLEFQEKHKGQFQIKL